MMTFKKTINAAFVAAIAFTMTACGGSSSTAGGVKTGTTSSYAYLLDTTDLEKPTLDLSNASGLTKSILDKGVLTVATSPDYPPQEWYVVDGSKQTLQGAEMILAKYVADCMGVDLKVETSDFDGTFLAIDTGKADIAFSGYGWKKDREENYTLSNGYISDSTDTEASKHTLIVPAGEEGNYNSLEDFVGKTIEAQVNSLQEMYVQDEIVALDPDGAKGTEYIPNKQIDQLLLELASGKCDAVALDNSTAENHVKASDGKFALSGVYFDLTPYGEKQGTVAMCKKSETEFMEIVNQCIAVAQEKGYYEEWYKLSKELAGISDEE